MSPTTLKFDVIFLLLVVVSICQCNEKHWLPDLEWQTGSNWIGGETPDFECRAIFPEQTWHAVGLPNIGNLEIAEIYLPREGSIYLGLNGALAFTKTKNSPRNVQWSKKGIYMWIDPDNWNGYNNATPHSERIPCDNDIVVLPSKNRTLSMALPQVNLHVLGIRTEDDKTTFNRWEWTQLANGPREFFQNRLTVTYASAMLQMCNDCTCHSGMDEAVAEEVCTYMWQSEKCGPSVCEYPLKVEGHCCDYCGGRVSLSSMASLREVETRVSETLKNYRAAITWHVRKTWNGRVEVLIVENGPYNGIKSQEAVDSLTDKLMDDGYEIVEKMTTGAALSDTSLSTVLGPLLGIPVILVIIILLVFPYFGYTYAQLMNGCREAWSSFTIVGNTEMTKKPGGFFGFARFENIAEGDVKLDENASTEANAEDSTEEDSDVDRPTTSSSKRNTSSSSKRFENPLYRSKRDNLNKEQGKSVITEERMIDIDAPVSLMTLESRVIHDDSVNDEVSLDSVNLETN